MPVLLAFAVGAFLLQVAPASAVFRPGPPPSRATVRGNTEMQMSGTGPGQGVTGYIADPGNPFDPVADGYPSSNSTSGFTAKDEGFAGVIYGTPTGGGATLKLYCIDINTNTWGGIGYALGVGTRPGYPTWGMWLGCSMTTTPIPMNPPG